VDNGSNGNALAKRDDSPAGRLHMFLKPRLQSLGQYVAGRVKPDVLIKLALLEFSKSKDLQSCDPGSIYAALITSAQLGLEPGAAKGEAYLVSYRGQCTLIPGYRGLIKLALRSKAVKSLYAHVVYQHDEFAIELGSEQRVVHRPALDVDRGPIIGAYAVAKFENDEIDVEWMGVAELERIRNASPGRNSGAYRDWLAEMYRKAPLRRLSKRLPLGDDFFQAAAVDEAHEAGKDIPRVELVENMSEAEVVEDASGAPNSLRDKVRQKAEGQ